MSRFRSGLLCAFVSLLIQLTVFAQKPNLVVQTTHSMGVMAISNDGKLMATAGSDRAVKLWDLRTARLLRTLHSKGGVDSLAFSADGTGLAGSSEAITMWDIATGEIRYRIDGQGPICISPVTNMLAGVTKTGQVVVWDGTTGKKIRELGQFYRKLLGGNAKLDAMFRQRRSHPDRVETIDFSPDAKFVAAGGTATPAFAIWNVETGKEVFHLDAQKISCVGYDCFATSDFEVKALRFNTLSTQLAVTNGGASVRIYEFLTDKWSEIKHPDKSLEFSYFLSGGTGVVGVRNSGDVVLWDWVSKKSEDVFKAKVSNPEISNVATTLAMAGGSSQNVEILNLENRERNTLGAAQASPSEGLSFGSDERSIISWQVRKDDKPKIKTWWIESEKLESRRGMEDIQIINVSPNRKLLAAATSDTIEIWDIESYRLVRTLTETGSVDDLVFSHDNRFLATCDGGSPINEPGMCNVWELSSGRIRRSFKSRYTYGGGAIAIQPGRGLIATAGAERMTLDGLTNQWLELYDPKSESVRILPFRNGHRGAPIAFTPDGTWLAAATHEGEVLLESMEKRDGVDDLRLFSGHTALVVSLIFSSDGKTLVTASEDNTVKIWDVETERELRTLKGHSSSVISLAFNPKEDLLLSGSEDNTVKLWDLKTGELLANLVAIGESEWLVATPDGLFDGSPASWKTLDWRFNNNTFDLAPVEAFFSEFYYPGLLKEIFAGKRPKAIANIEQKDRRPAQLKITVPNLPEQVSSTRNVAVRIEVVDAPAGAKDVRLFRNGGLVKVWPGDVLKEQKSVTLEASIAIVAGENKLTAYAFNHDNIKSTDVSVKITGAESLKRKGTLHILAIGVGEYSNSEYNLNYTPQDATAIASQLKLQQEKLGDYQSVKVLTLLNQQANKGNILGELKKLSGVVQPEDAVVLYFSGHGKASGDHFYLLPHDLAYSGSRDDLTSEGLKQILAQSISDDELEEAFRTIDAGRFFMIIDACNSGQALENKDEPRRGPMNTRGLAQLAYEKGMYIMTASQSVEEAFVSQKLKHSYLTYALVEEGLKTKVADANKDGSIALREWFDYALDRVPKLRAEQLQTKGLEEVGGSLKIVKRQLSQTPRVFYRREVELQPFVVARP